MSLQQTRAQVRDLPLDTTTRGEWLAWLVAMDRGQLPRARAALELQDWRARLGLDGSVVGDRLAHAAAPAVAPAAADPRALARQGERDAAAWLEEFRGWMTESQRSAFHRRVVMQLGVAAMVDDRARSTQLVLEASNAWREIAHVVLANMRSPLTMLQDRGQETAAQWFNSTNAMAQAGRNMLGSAIPWGWLGLGVVGVAGALWVASRNNR